MRKLTYHQQLVMNEYNLKPDCVNDEHELLERVWVTYGWDETKSLYWNLQRMPRAESIARARRRLHELGLIFYSKDAEKARYSAYKKDTERYGQDITPKVVAPRYRVIKIDGELVTEAY